MYYANLSCLSYKVGSMKKYLRVIYGIYLRLFSSLLLFVLILVEILPMGRRISTLFFERVWGRFHKVQTEKGPIYFCTPDWLSKFRANSFYEKEPETIKFIETFNAESVFWDVGANIGIYSIYASKLKNTRVYSFEPSLLNVELLFRNIQINDLGKKIPVVTILTRNQGDAAKIAKSFYLQYPVYKWITFKELRGLPREQFASELSKSCLAVWVDEQSSFGTFPLEAIESNTPVIGKIPNMIPEWMESVDAEGNVTIKQNGVWTNTTLNIPELIATYLKVWLEDAIPSDLKDGINESKGLYTSEKQIEAATNVYSALRENRLNELKITLETLENAQKEITTNV